MKMLMASGKLYGADENMSSCRTLRAAHSYAARFLDKKSVPGSFESSFFRLFNGDLIDRGVEERLYQDAVGLGPHK